MSWAKQSRARRTDDTPNACVSTCWKSIGTKTGDVPEWHVRWRQPSSEKPHLPKASRKTRTAQFNIEFLLKVRPLFDLICQLHLQSVASRWREEIIAAAAHARFRASAAPSSAMAACKASALARVRGHCSASGDARNSRTAEYSFNREAAIPSAIEERLIHTATNNETTPLGHRAKSRMKRRHKPTTTTTMRTTTAE
ncbi:unnamed protein product [Prorocentrum cordatum]|uniref:Uncharacterized protein n=1 Tax=Prorocentrum cordatum TaxID=2364126 RepID=A0ABN9QSD4_9DINO|nr:unnamed protein product [Polarella glacialis]